MALSEASAQRAIESLSRKMGSKNTSVLLNRLGENKQFVNAIDSPAGKEILALVVRDIENLIDKIIQPGLDEKKWCDLFSEYLNLQATLRFNEKVISKLNAYNKDRQKFEKAMGD